MAQQRFPLDWQLSEVGDFFDIKQGKSLSAAKQTGQYLKPFLRTSNVFWGKLDLTSIDQMDFTPQERDSLRLLRGDVLVCEGGDIGRTAVWTGELSECYYQNHLHRLRRKNANVCPQYFTYWMQAGFQQFNLYSGHGNKTTIPNLSQSRLKKFAFPLPPLLEQQKIATILFKIQQAIEVQESIIERMQELKRATMQHVFTYGLRGEKTKETEIGRVPESWEVVPIEKAYDFTKKPKHIVYSDYDSLAFIPMDLIPNDNPHLEKFMYRKASEISSGTYFEDGDILIAKITPCFENGKQCIVTGSPNGFGIATTEVIPIKEKVGVSNKYLLFYYLLKSNVRALIAGKMEGATGRQRVPNHLIKELAIPLPSLDEQKEISKVFLTIDKKIELHTAKKSALQDLFKTMLNKLMTGEIRVRDLEIDVSGI